MDPFIIYIGGLYNAEAEHRELSHAIGTRNYGAVSKNQQLIVPCILSDLLSVETRSVTLETTVANYMKTANLYVEIIAVGYGNLQLDAARFARSAAEKSGLPRRIYAQHSLTRAVKHEDYDYHAKEFLDHTPLCEIIQYSTPHQLVQDFANYLHSEEFKQLLK